MACFFGMNWFYAQNILIYFRHNSFRHTRLWIFSCKGNIFVFPFQRDSYLCKLKDERLGITRAYHHTFKMGMSCKGMVKVGFVVLENLNIIVDCN